jgi:hypothetical protein
VVFYSNIGKRISKSDVWAAPAEACQALEPKLQHSGRGRLVAFDGSNERAPTLCAKSPPLNESGARMSDRIRFSDAHVCSPSPALMHADTQHCVYDMVQSVNCTGGSSVAVYIHIHRRIALWTSLSCYANVLSPQPQPWIFHHNQFHHGTPKYDGQ